DIGRTFMTGSRQTRARLYAAVLVDTEQLGHDSKARRFIQGDGTFVHVQNRTAELITQQIVVGVDLQPAITSDAGKQMRGRKQADTAAEIVRAKRFAGLENIARQSRAYGEPAPFGDIRL